MREHLKQVLSYLERRGIVKNAKRHEVGVFLVPNRELVAVKKKFFGKAPKTVDVLAFPEPGKFPHPETRKISLGEIYLNREDALASPARGRFLLRHGLLHLLGYRHRGKSDTIKMQNLEKELQEHYDTGLATHNRLGHRHRIRQSGRRGKSRRSSRA